MHPPRRAMPPLLAVLLLVPAALAAGDRRAPLMIKSPWVKKVHIVSMTHLDVGGWGPGPGKSGCENSCNSAVVQ